MTRKPVILTGLGILLVALFCVFILTFQSGQQQNILSQEKLMELRKDYPVYNEDPPFTSMIRPSFQDIMIRSETVVIGEVISELPEYTVNLVNPGTAEEQLEYKARSHGLLSSEASFKQYEVKVIKQVAGEPVEDTIRLAFNADFAGYEPDLSPGMSIITGIAKGRDVHEGKYFFTRFGTYYVIDEQYVLSAVDDEFSKTMNGQTIDLLIDNILVIFKE